MQAVANPTYIAGVDGCKAGWVAVTMEAGAPADATLLVFKTFSELLNALPSSTIIAVDMPIGLPDFVGPEGRGPEKAVRKLLGERQSSVFSVPARSAVYCEDYREACRVAEETSNPPRKVSKQCFYLFPKIREIDALLAPGLERQLFEVHPEVAFWRLNGERPMSLPKKVKSSNHPSGLEQRRELLVLKGYSQTFLEQPLGRGVHRDDVLDAAANCLIAGRIARGEATPFPATDKRDKKGWRIAIWA